MCKAQMGQDVDDFLAKLQALKETLCSYMVLLVEAFMVWSLNNRTHALAKDLLSQQVSNVATKKFGIREQMILKPLYDKATA